MLKFKIPSNCYVSLIQWDFCLPSFLLLQRDLRLLAVLKFLFNLRCLVLEHAHHVALVLHQHLHKLKLVVLLLLDCVEHILHLRVHRLETLVESLLDNLDRIFHLVAHVALIPLDTGRVDVSLLKQFLLLLSDQVKPPNVICEQLCAHPQHVAVLILHHI